MKGWTLAFSLLGVISIITFAVTDITPVRVLNVVLLVICIAAVVWLQRTKKNT